MTRRPLRLAGHGLVVSRRVAYARAIRPARAMVRRIEAKLGHALPPWQREVVVHRFTAMRQALAAIAAYEGREVSE